MTESTGNDYIKTILLSYKKGCVRQKLNSIAYIGKTVAQI